MPGVIFPIPTDASGAPEANRWQGTTVEPTLTERIAGHDPYPAPPPAYDVENYARYAQWQNNLRLQAVALVAERASVTVTLAGATVGNQRRITVNGTNIDYSDTGGQTVSDVADSFALAINSNVTVTAGANAVFAAANFAGAGTVTIASLQPGVAGNPTIAVAVLAGAGTITAGTITVPDIVIPEEFLTGGTGNIVLGSSANDTGPDNDVRLVLDRITGAFRAGSVSATQWDTRASGSIGIGVQAVPVADDAIAIGTGSDATAVADIAIGLNSAANSGGSGNDQATAIGDTALAQGEAALAVGFGTSATAAFATALGLSATANATSSLAIGPVAAATAANAVAIGPAATSSAAQAVSLGLGATAGAANATAIGENAQATGDGALATGHAATLGNVLASGDGARAHGLGGATLYAVTASGDGAEAMGRGVVASGDYATATGFGATAGNRGEVAHASLGITDIAGPSVEAATHQAGRLIVQCRTDAGATRRFRPDAIDQAGGATWTPMDDRSYGVKVKLVGTVEGANNTLFYTIEGAVAKAAGTVTVGTALGGAFALVDDIAAGFTAPTLSITASGGNVVMDVTNNSASPARWTAEIEYVQAGINY